MRLPPLPPAQLAPELRTLHDEMTQAIDAHLKGFVSKRADGALIGPFAPMLRFPQFGRPAWDYTKALISNAKLPKAAHETAILATGAVLNSRYELYVHEHVAAGSGLSLAKIATIAAGQRPPDLDEAEAIAYDAATALASGKSLPESTFLRAVRVFGEEQVAELVYLIAGYCLVSVLLNAYDMSVPGREEGLPDETAT